MESQDIYLNLLTDYAFKHVFGQEQNKDILIDFINTVLEGEQRIMDLQFAPNERLGLQEDDRKMIFDLFCKNDRGEMIVVELQQARQTYFKDRALYYLSSLIQEQGVRGKWDYHLQPTYLIAILHFEIEPGTPHIHRIKLHNESLGSTWSESISMIFLELSKFTKTLDDCQNHFERWLYLLRNLHRLQRLPAKFQEKVFLHLFAVAEIGRFPEAERIRYQSSLTEMERMDEFLKYAKMVAEQEGHAKGHAKGLAEGLAEGHAEGHAEGRTEEQLNALRDKIDIIQNMLNHGLSWEMIQAIAHVDEQGFAEMKAKATPLGN